jgi:hypothetical protein
MSKEYVMDQTLSWEERYAKLEAHHIEETTELITKLRGLRHLLWQAFERMTSPENPAEQLVEDRVREALQRKQE